MVKTSKWCFLILIATIVTSFLWSDPEFSVQNGLKSYSTIGLETIWAQLVLVGHDITTSLHFLRAATREYECLTFGSK